MSSEQDSLNAKAIYYKGRHIRIVKAKRTENTVTIRKNTVGTVPVLGKPGRTSLEFIFDAQVDGRISLISSPSNNYCDPGGEEIFTVEVKKGRSQMFTQVAEIDLSDIEGDKNIRDGDKVIYQLGILTQPCSDDSSPIETYEITYVAFEKEQARAVWQVNVVDGNAYEMESTFGNENLDTNEKNVGDECDVCMDKAIDTLMLPCKHSNVCYDCAVTCLKSSGECPICRKDVHTLE